MGKASNVNIGRIKIFWNFFRGGHRKMQKTGFFRFSANYLRFWYWNTYPGYHHVKPHVQTNPKMYNLVGLRWFLRQLLPLEVSTWRKKWKRHDNYEALQKKDTATILSFGPFHWISVEPTMLGQRWFNGKAQNSKLWPCLFFWTPPLHWIFS